MKALRKQINESFFNPILHFLPLMVFMVVNDFWGIKTAWLVTLPVNLILLIYIHFFYRKIIDWFVFSSLIVFFTGGIISIVPVDKLPKIIGNTALENLVLFVFVLSLIFRKRIETFIYSLERKLPPMINNLNELFRMIKILSVLIFFYISINTLLFVLPVPQPENALNFVHDAYLTVFFFVIFYELIRVTIIRVHLLKEEWWPILNENGKMIGSIHSKTSLQEEKKYIHPVIRVMLIENNRIFLQKRCRQDPFFPGYWDTAISNHVKVNETVEQCISRTVNERYGIKTLKPIFLSNYTHETPDEYHYAFLFVACKLPEFELNPEYIDSAKWWTVKQIEDNTTTGIFTENFLTEFEVVKRSGLLEPGSCDCKCSLKETVLNGYSK